MAPESSKITVPSKVAAAMLLVGVFHWSWSYYDLLRVVVCGAAVYAAWFAKQQKSERLLWIMVFVAVLYNPIAPVYLDRRVWSLFNLAGAVLFWLTATNLKRVL